MIISQPTTWQLDTTREAEPKEHAEAMVTVGDTTPSFLRKVEAEAMERWLDDGGASDHEAVYDARGFSPLQVFKP